MERGLIFILLTAHIEILLHWYWIEVRKIDLNQNDKSWKFPSHRWAFVIRGAYIGGFVYLVAGFGLLLLLPLWWFIFHYGLNIVRPEKSLYYLGDNFFDNLLFEVDYALGKKTRFVLHAVITLIFTWMNLAL